MSKLPQHIRSRKKEIVESDGPWMIWSRYHGAWHRRSVADGASGYTSDILQAGVWIDPETPAAYNDERDRPIRLKHLLPQIQREGDEAIRRAHTASVMRSMLKR